MITTSVERLEIKLFRLKYLKKVQQYRKENRPIVFTDVTYIHTLNLRLGLFPKTLKQE